MVEVKCCQFVINKKYKTPFGHHCSPIFCSSHFILLRNNMIFILMSTLCQLPSPTFLLRTRGQAKKWVQGLFQFKAWVLSSFLTRYSWILTRIKPISLSPLHFNYARTLIIKHPTRATASKQATSLSRCLSFRICVVSSFPFHTCF